MTTNEEVDEILEGSLLAEILERSLKLYRQNQIAILLVAKTVGIDPDQLLRDAEMLAEDDEALHRMLTEKTK